jgi:ribosomal protein S6--L-glutamate ligase
MKIHVLVFGRPNRLGAVTVKNLDLLQAAAEKLGHEMVVIHDSECHMEFGSKPGLFIMGHKIKDIKVLIVQANIAGENLMYRSTLIRQFEDLGVTVVNKELAVMKAKNKLRTLQVLLRHKIPVPKTFVITHSEYLDEIINQIGSFPMILKSVSGSHGRGVSIVESKRGLKSVVEMLTKDASAAQPLLVQEYVKESSGKDVRVFIVGKRIVAAMERIAKRRGEFRSNFHLGGRVRVAEMTEREKRVSFDSMAACGLDFAGVDVIRTNEGPKILEVNSNPGLEGITLATGRDIAGEIIKYAVRKAKRVINKKK